jgi:hypothetical protein
MDGESTNLALIRRLYNDCWVQGRFELMAEILDPEIVWTAIESAPDAGTRRGYRDCQAYMEDWIGGFELEPQSIEAAGTGADGRLVCDHRAVGTERRSRLRTDIHYPSRTALRRTAGSPRSTSTRQSTTPSPPAGRREGPRPARHAAVMSSAAKRRRSSRAPRPW